MVDVTVKILEPANDFGLMSVQEAKLALGIPSGDTSSDQQISWLIETQSSVISVMCNRVFAKERVQETWRENASRRIYLTHWPVKEADIESVTSGGYYLFDYELEEQSGKLSVFSNAVGPVVVTYVGGYSLPDEAPLALKQCCSLLVTTTKTEQAAAQLTGIRMISHKESRVMFHSGTGSQAGGNGGASTQTKETVQALLYHFVRHWI